VVPPASVRGPRRVHGTPTMSDPYASVLRRLPTGGSEPLRGPVEVLAVSGYIRGGERKETQRSPNFDLNLGPFATKQMRVLPPTHFSTESVNSKTPTRIVQNPSDENAQSHVSDKNWQIRSTHPPISSKEESGTFYVAENTSTSLQNAKNPGSRIQNPESRTQNP